MGIGRNFRSPFNPEPDSRVGRLLRRSRLNPESLPFEAVSDSLRAHGYGTAPTIHYGVVIQAIPYLGWYRVQADLGFGVIAAFDSSKTQPIGPQDIAAYPPGSTVLMIRYPAFNEWQIIGSAASPTAGVTAATESPLLPYDAALFGADPLYASIARMLGGGGTSRAGRGTTPDGSIFDAGWIDPDTGTGVFSDPFTANLVAGRNCGVSVLSPDQIARIFGIHVQSWSQGDAYSSGDDEGEGYVERQVYPYPQLAPRFAEYLGYLGQGKTQVTKLDDSTLVGLDHTGLDGSRVISSATRILLYKATGTGPGPVRVKQVYDPTGDSGVADNYKAAGMFGNGPDHVVGELPENMPVDDLISFLTGWKWQHPFRLHENDFQFAGTTVPHDVITPGVGPTLVRMTVDSRYYALTAPRSSYFLQDNDGSVKIGSGGLGEIHMTADGDIIISTPGRLILNAGQTVALMGDECAITTNRSIDITAGADIRAIATSNAMLAGNGVLIEGKGSGQVNFIDAVGENVYSTGVTVRSAGNLALIGQEIGVDGPFTVYSGDSRILVSEFGIVIDSNQVYVTSKTSGISLTGGQNVIDGSTIVSGNLSVGGDILGSNSLTVASSVSAGGSVNDKDSGARAQSRISGESQTAAENAKSSISNAEQSADDVWRNPQTPLNIQQQQWMIAAYRGDLDYVKRQIIQPRWWTWAAVGTVTNIASFAVFPIDLQGLLTYPWPGRFGWEENGIARRPIGLAYDYETGLPKPPAPPGQVQPSEVIGIGNVIPIVRT